MKIMRPSLLIGGLQIDGNRGRNFKILAEERNMRKAAERLFYPNQPFHNDCKRLRKTGVHNYLFVHKRFNSNTCW